MNNDKEYIDIKRTFESFRKNKEKLTESEKQDETVAYTQQDEMLQNALETTKKQFGADYSNFKTPMLYYPKDNDVVLSGSVPGLNNLKFQFRLQDPSGNGCYIWVESIQLTDENLRKLNVIHGVYKNWKDELSASGDIKPISLKNKA